MKHPTPSHLGVSRETADRLAAYIDVLARWNGTINLVSPCDMQHVWERHVLDSLQLAPLIPTDLTHATDLGSGAGFPGLVLAVATGHTFHLVEADQRKAAFLREAIRKTGAPAIVHAVRIESAQIPLAPVVTARAVAPLPVLLGWAYRLLLPRGICLFPKGRTAEDELTATRGEWHMRVSKTASRTDAAASILRISEIGRIEHNA